MGRLAAFLRKDVLLQLRDYKELALLLLMPVILTAILGFALGGFLTGEPVRLDIAAGLVVEDDPEAGRAAFRGALAAAELPPAQRLGLSVAASTLQPLELVTGVITSPEMGELLTVEALGAAEARERLAADELQAVIGLPEGFTERLLNGMLLGEASATLELQLSDASPLRAGIVRDVLSGFAREVSFQSALGQALQGPPPAPPSVSGTIERVRVGGNVPAVAFYTFGMAVMFALYVAGGVSSRAFLERLDLTFDRVLLSGAHPLGYLASKALSGAVVVLLQLAFLLAAGTLLLGAFRGQPPAFWLAAGGVSLALALCVGALGAFVTALNFRAGNRALSNVFNSVVVTLLALLGGSFFPVQDEASLLGRLGAWTPNGAALNGYLSAAKGLAPGFYLDDVLRLLLMAAALLALALALFPRRSVA